LRLYNISFTYFEIELWSPRKLAQHCEECRSMGWNRCQLAVQGSGTLLSSNLEESLYKSPYWMNEWMNEWMDEWMDEWMATRDTEGERKDIKRRRDRQRETERDTERDWEIDRETETFICVSVILTNVCTPDGSDPPSLFPNSQHFFTTQFHTRGEDVDVNKSIHTCTDLHSYNALHPSEKIDDFFCFQEQTPSANVWRFLQYVSWRKEGRIEGRKSGGMKETGCVFMQ